jgi:hypothetical protein
MSDPKQDRSLRAPPLSTRASFRTSEAWAQQLAY